MFASMFFILACAFFNRVRGGLFPNLPGGRILASIGVGAATGIMAGDSYPAGIIAGAGFYLWALPGWGLYFACVTGRWNPTQREIPELDWISLSLVPFVTSTQHRSNYLRGILAMSIRGLFCSIPLFGGLSFIFTPAIWLIWPIFFAQGIIYWLFSHIYDEGKNPIGYCEWLWGAVMGAALLACMEGATLWG